MIEMIRLDPGSARLEYEWERQFAALNQHAIVSVADAAGRITYVNDLFCEISGYRRDELLGNTHRIVKSDRHEPAFYEDMWRTITSGRLWKGEVCNRRKDGTLYWVESTITPFLNAQGKPFQYVSIRTDITHVQAVQEKLLRQSEMQQCLTRVAQRLLALQPSNYGQVLHEVLADAATVLGAGSASLFRVERGALVLQTDWPLANGDAVRQRPLDAALNSFMHDLGSSRDRARFFTLADLAQAVPGLSAEQYQGDLLVVPLNGERRMEGVILFSSEQLQPTWREECGDQVVLLANMLLSAMARFNTTRELAATEERLRLGQKFANIGTWESDLVSGEFFWSEQIPSLFGFPDQLQPSLGQLFRAVHPEDRDLFREAHFNGFEAESSYEIEYRIIRQDSADEVRWLMERGTLVQGGNDSPAKLLSVVQDITERKETQLRLEKREAELQSAQRLARIGNWSYTYVTDRLQWSDIAAEIYGGQSAQEPPSIHAFWELVHPSDRTLVQQAYAKSTVSGGFDVINRIIRPDGSMGYVHQLGQPERDAAGNLIGLSGTVQDITERVESERKLRETEERFAFAVEGAGDGIWDWNISTGAMTHSRLYMEMLGYEQDELPHHISTWTESVHPDDMPGVSQILEDYLAGRRERYHVELRLRCKNGRYKWVLCRGVVVEHDSDGKPLRMIGIHSDITRMKEDEAALIAARNEAERANRAKSHFLSSMSHELRTPMNAILGFGQLMEYDVDLAAEHKDSVHEILKAGRHLLDLINEILDLAKVESGHMTISLEPVDLSDLVSESCSLVRPLARDRGIRLLADHLEPVRVIADKTRLKQVILNLLSNAVKYNRDHGSVSLCSELREGNVLRLIFEDTGYGISSEGLEGLFQPFNRIGAEKSGIEGTGIGLTLTKQLVELMGGSIGADSQLNIGSRFWIDMPLDTEAEPEDDLPAATRTVATEQRMPCKTVVYVDDNPSNIKLIRGILGRYPGVQLLDAHTPDLGIELVKQSHPDLVILDINMPGLDGYQVLKILKQIPAFADTPIIALTANAMSRDIEKGLAAGFKRYLTKPLEVPVLLEAIEEILVLDQETG
ncbi:PAS domain-containing protein [Marinobacterium sediminicola]|uniref:histidine kinase n=1 Tax=Marinobacterium sediminicola TaxID=518898 RepID=A0ABY1S2X2_9GAMM|nr:PAS domain-containing protein [Marinobacterium sediminicola]ULG69275.1 PAS domain-containing protein [Marinobacterium sediminicola]SMR77624.1 PAS domain S-box-containing protein [Marinobacterium sediminicola]